MDEVYYFSLTNIQDLIKDGTTDIGVTSRL